MRVNEKLAEIFFEMSVMLEILDDNEYRARAYNRAARSLEKLEDDICEIAKRDELERIPGIGKTLARQIKTWCRKETFEDYEKLKSRFPAGLFQLLDIPGLGPKKIKLLYKELGITTLGELEYACLENRLTDLKGFGAKTQEKILKNIEVVRTYSAFRRAPEAYRIAQVVGEKLKGIFQAVRLVGGLRRFQEITDDVDFLVYGEESAFFDILEKKKLLDGMKRISDTHIEGFFDGLRIDVWISKSFDAACLVYYTGSKDHVVKLQKIASDKGLTFSSSGIFSKNDSLLSFNSEKDVYEMLDLAFIPPELREDMGEIEAARNGSTPRLIEPEDIVGIFHVHTSASDGSLSLENVVEEAIRMGYQYVGISDHSKSAFYAGGLDERRLMKQYDEVVRLREKYPQIDIYWGIESDILPDGSLDYEDEILEKFDFVIGSIHSGFNMDKDAMTARLVRALNNPYLTILGHPTGRLLLGRDAYEVEMERIFDVAEAKSKVLELNAHPHRLDIGWGWCKKARDRSIPVAINPDAHKPADFDLTYGIMTARKGWLGPGDVWNAQSRETMREIMQSKPWLK